MRYSTIIVFSHLTKNEAPTRTSDFARDPGVWTQHRKVFQVQPQLQQWDRYQVRLLPGFRRLGPNETSHLRVQTDDTPGTTEDQGL